MKKSKALIVIILIWLAIAVILVCYNELLLRKGVVILLKTSPIDPRDIFRGDYVVLNYEISRINLREISTLINPDKIKAGDTVYVVFDKIGDHWKPFELSNSKPKGFSTFIRGKVTGKYENTLEVKYGIEEYFVPEGKGKEIEKLVGKELYVEVRINKSGKSSISKLFVNGKELILK